MSSRNECLIEQVAEESRIPFLSIKNTGDPSELVVNPNYFRELDVVASARGYTRAGKQWFQELCAECGHCHPDIHDDHGVVATNDPNMRSGIRVVRRGYNPDVVDCTLYYSEIHHFDTPKGNDQSRVRICCIDDNNFLWSDVFGHSPADVNAIWVNPHVHASPIATIQLIQLIVAWRPDWLISDKGMGYLDGIEIILRCKEAGIQTIMLTGEIQTDETRRVADYFLTKPVSSRTLQTLIWKDVGGDI